ncbi:MAG TPA: TonB-dependent copper receptor [Moraxellaceae bacterium]|nr:TonB-dependent copper receptor [Moraxellaceae bacterium]
MSHALRFAALPLAIACSLTFADDAVSVDSPDAAPLVTPLAEIVVTAPNMSSPLTVETDPKAPRQPVPAHDGADYLKSIPGFSIIRKGGTDGDPVFRGMAASRLNILANGETVLGGCGMRMDPPTAYLFPESYDRIRILKGPQSVEWGVGSAATVLFERDTPDFSTPKITGNASALAASFNRLELMGDLTAGTSAGYLRVQGTHSESDDYEDGSGKEVHSEYHRWSGNASLGWTPDDKTLIELTGGASDGEAAYADRMMDGSKFLRQNVGLRAKRTLDTGWLQSVEAQLYQNDVDHVMDNYSLRTFVPSMMMPNPSVSNPTRLTEGGRLTTVLIPGTNTQAKLGVDVQRNEHTLRSTMNQIMMPYLSMPVTTDDLFEQQGIFTEIEHAVSSTTRLAGGARADLWEVTDNRATVRNGMMTVPNPTANAVDKDTLTSGFVRLEHDITAQQQLLFGLGHSERIADYWERFSTQSTTTLSGFLTQPEQTTQLDAGWQFRSSDVKATVSLYLSDIRDYILIDTTVAGKVGTAVSRNINAKTWGGEADVAWAIATHWTLTGAIALARGENSTDGTDLAQMSPIEARLGVNYRQPTWSTGALLRLVNRQDSVDVGKGNIVGQDIGTTAGFGIFSLNASWTPVKALTLSSGIDNLFDKTYAEHLSRGGAMVSGFIQTTRVNEPGRLVWLKASTTF